MPSQPSRGLSPRIALPAAAGGAAPIEERKGDKDEELLSGLVAALVRRSDDMESRAPVVMLTGEEHNVFHVLERHFTWFPPPDRFWRVVRAAFTPALETWRPRVNGAQLKVLQGARLPEGEAEWGELRAALRSVRQHLRSNSSVERLMGELRDFAAMALDWWTNRKKQEGLKRVASQAQVPLAKRPGWEYLHQAAAAGLYPQPVYVQPEILTHPILSMGEVEGSLALPPVEGGVSPGGYMQQLQDDAQLFDKLFAPADGGQPAAAPPAEQQQQQQRAVEVSTGDDEAEGRPAAAAAARPAERRCVTLNVGGHRFLTTGPTLAAAPEGSYFWKLARQCSGSSRAPGEFFIDRSGKVFEYVLDFLRASRYGDPSASTLPREDRVLGLLLREAEFYALPALAARAREALQPPPPAALDAVFMETGFHKAEELAEAHAALLEALNVRLAARQAEGYAVVQHNCGVEHEEGWRNLHYHVLLQRKAAP